MPYIGNPITSGENNSFKVLDDITSYTLTFNGSSASIVSVANNTITYNSHRFITGQRVTYNTTGTAITGLTAATVYFIIKEDQNTIKLATTYANAINNTAIDLTGLGTGTTHTINVAFDGVNTKFKATYDNGTKAQITRAAQLTLSVNGVIQQPQDTTSPTNGFGIDLDSVIIFSVAPLVTDIFWGNLVANNFPTFDISDNTVDSFTGTGSLTAFTLSKEPANSQNLLVTIDGVVQYPSDNTNVRAYSVVSNVLTFEGAPGNGTDIQVRHIGFAGATSSNVTGFYGRTGNVGLTTADNVNVGIITATTSITVGSAFIKNNAVGLGVTTTVGRNAGISTATGTIIFNSNNAKVQVYNGTEWVSVGAEQYIEATGGTISDYTSGSYIYRAHIFTSSGSLSITKAPASQSTVEYLVVAGGGGASSYYSGGGGAGGFRTGTGFPVSTSPGAYTITVGAGGVGNATATLPSAGIGANGIDSVFAPGYVGVVTSTGGGGGASRQTGGAGGSGGGGGNASTSGGAGNTPPSSPPLGNSGGNGNGTGGASDIAAGGGGGATAAGTSGVYNTTRGVGGAGTPSSITGITTHYAGGGGGGASGSLGPARTSGGSGGGGSGGGQGPTVFPGLDGTYSTGGGGGGGGEVPGTGGSGGSGIVVVRYLIGELAATAKATGGLISYASGKTIHQFLSSGTFTVTNPGLSDVDYLVVAGGGGGGTHSGGGGGAGGLISNHPDMPSPRRGSAVPISPGPYAVVVGAGGAGGDGLYPSPISSEGSDGLPSSIAFPTPVSTAGGGGGGNQDAIGRAGGSGGGGGRTNAGGTVSPPSNQGFAGGSPGVGGGPNNSYPGGGGGGAGGLGLGSITNGGAGGPGLPISISGTSVTYAGGGGGNSQYAPGVGGAGGPGGGGSGSSNSGLGVDGTTNLGAGGGGGQYDGGTGSGNNNGNGGSGIVIIAYPS